jgi:NDP-sugar pyrophosphorylase family protein
VIDLPVAILAGGLATRLRPITETIPKSLVEAAGEPFVAHQLRLLAKEGVKHVVFCVGYLGEMIEEFVGDGARFGLKVEYVFDGEKLLGTGGALKKALPKLGEAFMILYGDSYLDISYAPVAKAFTASGKQGLMTVFRNQGRFDTSNVVYEDGRVICYSKKKRLPEMDYIDYGLSVLKAESFAAWPDDEPFDLALVLERLSEENQLAGFEVSKRFYEIGSPEGLAAADEYLRGKDS